MQLDRLRRAFGLAHRAAETETYDPGTRAIFRAIAYELWMSLSERKPGEGNDRG